MTRRALVGAAALWALLFVVAGSPAGAISTPTTEPTATSNVDGVALGGAIRLTGSGWDPTQGLVEIELCGNLALNGSVDCDVANTVDSAITSNGTFTTAMIATAPPSPCPCVVRIGYSSVPAEVKLPIVIKGVAVRAPQAFPQVLRQVSVVGVAIEGSGPWWSWFGGAPRRRVVYTVVNTGEVVLDNPALSVNFGRGDDPSGYVSTSQIGELNVGQSKTFSAPVPFSAPAFGSYTVTVTVDPIGLVGTGQDTTAVVPWGLIVVLAVLLSILVLWARAVVQRRRAAHPDGSDDPIAAAEISGAAVVGSQLGWGGAPFVEELEPLVGAARSVVPVEITHDWAGPWMPLARHTRVVVDAASRPADGATSTL